MKTCNVVIVDDEAMIRRGIERIVLSSGKAWNVLGLFSDGMEALAYIKSNPNRIDLVITDVKMPGMDGLELIREAKRYASFIPLLISGYDDFEYVRTALREGAVDYVLKPIDRKQFSAQLRELHASVIRSRKEKAIHFLAQMAEESAEKVDVRWENFFAEGVYQLFIVSIDQPPVKTRVYTKVDWRLMRYALANIVEEITDRDEEGTCWAWERSDASIGVLRLTDCEREDAADCLRLAEQIRGAVARTLPFTVSVSISSPFHDLDLLADMNRQAGTMLYYRLLDGGNQVLVADRLGGPDKERVPADVWQVAKMVRRKLEGTMPIVEQDVDSFFSLVQSYRDPIAIEAAVRYLLLQILFVRVDADPEVMKPGALEQLLDLSPYTRNIKELRQVVLEEIRKTIQFVQERRENVDRKPVEQAMVWIREHLSERLTIRKIANRVHLNPTYFCQLFKLQTGETVLDYMTRLRMEEAARMLAQGCKVAEAAERLGYRDSKYFTQLFKQHYGVPPSRYRAPDYEANELTDRQ